MLPSGFTHSRACNEPLPNSISETSKSIKALGETSLEGSCSSVGPNANGERLVTIRMAKRARGDRLRMDNDVLRYRFGYEGSVTACAALRAATDCFLADT